MNPKALIPIVAAAFMGLIAAFLARHVISGKGPIVDRAPIVRLVVAKSDVAPGHALTAEDLTLAPIVAAAPPPNSYTDPARLVGRVVRGGLVTGQPVLDPLLAPAGVPEGLQALVPEGMRAISLETNESSGLIGLLSPGSRVDVVTTATTANDAERAISRIIAQNVRVLAVGQRLSAGPQPAEAQASVSRTVTLLVTPHDAAALDLAQSMARLRLILRGNGDADEVDDDAVMMVDLRGGTSTGGTTVIVPAGSTASTQPVTATPPIAAAQPSTRPAIDPTTPPEPARRVVMLIMGDKEQRLSFREQPKAGDAELSTTKDPFAEP